MTVRGTEASRAVRTLINLHNGRDMNRNSLMCFIVFTIMSMTACSRGRGPAITQAELVRRTQEIFDAVGTSNRAPFEKYFAADCMVFDEKGRMTIAVWFNNDTGDSWEWADDPSYPEKFSALGIRIMLNHVVYAMSH